MFINPYPSQINCFGKFLCFFFVTLLHVMRTLWKYLPMVHPLPTGKLGKLTPPSLPWIIRSLLWGWYGYFLEPHNVTGKILYPDTNNEGPLNTPLQNAFMLKY